MNAMTKSLAFNNDSKLTSAKLLLSLAVMAFSIGLHAATHTVEMANFQFVPRDISIDAGDTITWVNKDLPQHDTVSGSFGIPSGVWDSNDQFGRLMSRNEVYSFSFPSAGTFPYYCTPHWAAQDMNGSVSVVSTLPPPSVISSTQWSSGSLTITFSTVAGSTYHVEASPVLPTQSWTRLTTLVATGDTLSFTDEEGLTKRFYRIVSE